MRASAFRWFLFAVSAAMPCLLWADDTDIYLSPRGSEVSEPMVMFSLDYRSNLGASASDQTEFFAARLGADDIDIPRNRAWTFFDVLRLSLKVVFLEISGVKVGLMLNHDYSNNCAGPSNALPKNKSNQNCSNGGYIARGFRSIQPNDANGSVQEFVNILRSIPVPGGNQSHSYQGAELFFELFRYLTGQPVWNGHVGYRDYAGNLAQNLDVNFPAVSWDRRIENPAGTQYLSPIEGGSSCSSIYTVNLMFQVSNQDANSNSEISKSIADGGLGFNPGNSNTFPNMIAKLNQTDLANGEFGSAPSLAGVQNVTSYFVVDPRFINNNTRSYSQAGGTGEPLAFSDDPQILIDTLRGILQEILSVSATFVSASVPVNVFNRAEIVDNVYVALFQAEKTPRWSGNVKKLVIDERLEADGSRASVLMDANDQSAVAGDGRIRFDALTFWTNPAGRDVIEQDLDNGLFFGKDGRHTQRGGVAQQIPGYLTSNPGLTNAASGARQLFYASGSALAALDATAAVAGTLQSRMGAASVAEAEALLRYARGFDGASATSAVVRDVWMGDPMHSRPLPINYGQRGAYTEANQAIYIAFGSNDGFFRMVRNTQPGATPVQDGREVWAFMPDEVMGIQKRLRDDNADATLPLHPYGVDGAPSSLLLDVDPATGVPAQALVFFGLRRGGRAYYALNVSNPEAPTLAWRISHTTPGFSRLGLTFSQPQVGKIRQDGVDTPVVVFSAGYDVNKDYYAPPQPKTLGSNDAVGNAVYVVNALTGALIWEGIHPELVDSIPSDLTVADTSGDGLIDRIVFGDTGGNVWRADLPVGSPAGWALHKLAALGRHDVATRQNDRRFFHAPDLVQTKDTNGTPYDAVVIGSGDRADPLDKGDGGLPQNWLYAIRDPDIGVLTAAQKEGRTPRRHADINDITECVPFEECGGVALTHGWKMALEVAPGEKILSTPFTFLGTIFVTSYLPPGNGFEPLTCGPSEGAGLLYSVRLDNGTPRFNLDLTDDSPVLDDEPTTKTDRYRLLASGGIPSEVVYIGGGSLLLGDLSIVSAGAEPRLPTFWRRNELSDRTIITVNEAPPDEDEVPAP